MALRTVGEHSISKNLPTIMQDLSRRSIATSGESVSTYPRRPKAEAFSNAVDIFELLRDPTDACTKCTAPPRSAHVQLDNVPRALDLVESEGEFRQLDGVATMMMYTGITSKISRPTPCCIYYYNSTDRLLSSMHSVLSSWRNRVMQ